MTLRLYPRSLGGQLLAMLLLALLVTQGLGYVLFADERSRALRSALGLEAAGRAANVALLLDDAPQDLHGSILRSASSPLVSFTLGPEPMVVEDGADTMAFIARMREILGASMRDVRANVHARAPMPVMAPPGFPAAMRAMHEGMMAEQAESLELALSVRLAQGNWLNVRTLFDQPALQVSPGALLPLALMAAAVALVALVTARRVVGPMRALAAGADRLGRGLDADPLPLTGPTEVRETTLAFNRMQDRLTRFVTERTHLLAAISHDLRSPLTAMRLRLELLDEGEDTDRLRALVDEMQEMVEATLAFARGAAQTEPAATVDLAVVLADLAADAGAGKAEFAPAAPVIATVRPNALNRALRNLIDNAIRYGDAAQISLVREPGAARITIADSGPGLPEDQLQAVFEPFVRFETSRSRDTGGAGLGLAIARTIVQAHGGEVTLQNRPDGGLQAVVRLPLAAG
ncbi:MAG: HAMP domain-containing protein [Rhodobacteraceae bacterium]|nr:HAMP domain-containing protein [Paracoccaceae bacterium]